MSQSLPVRIGAGLTAFSLVLLLAARTASQSAPGPALGVNLLPDNTVRLSWPDGAADFELEWTTGLESADGWQPVGKEPVPANGRLSVTLGPEAHVRFFRLRRNAPIPIRVESLAPLDGAGEVGVTYRPQIQFTRPIDPATLTPQSFYATAAGPYH